MNISIKSFFIASILILLGFSFGRYWAVSNMYKYHMQEHEHTMDEVDRDSYISMKDEMIGRMVSEESYRCCLEKPCTYCIEKSPKHGEGASCSCLEDVVNGVHPCGECIGEILEGHGNRFLAKYFAQAISEEVGIQYKDTIKQIISDKYEISLDVQL